MLKYNFYTFIQRQDYIITFQALKIFGKRSHSIFQELQTVISDILNVLFKSLSYVVLKNTCIQNSIEKHPDSFLHHAQDDTFMLFLYLHHI